MPTPGPLTRRLMSAGKASRLARSLHLKLYAPLVELHLAEDSPSFGELTLMECPKAVYAALPALIRRAEEELWALHLDVQNRLLARQMVSRGALNTVRTAPREIFRAAILNGAIGVILAHNHPSGNLEPSPDDIEFTKAISKAGELIGIHLLDHVIVTKGGYTSFREKGLM